MIDSKPLWKESFPHFYECDDPTITGLMETAKLVEIPARHAVFYPGSRCESYLLVAKGTLRTQIVTENGREVVLYHVRSGESCILTTSCLLGDEHYPAEGVTQEDVLAFSITRDGFQQALDSSSFFRQFVFQNFAKRLATVLARVDEIIFGPIDQRLAQILLAMKETTIKRTHQELAVELGSAREVVSRHLKRFESNAWIQLGRGEIILNNPAALERIANRRICH